MRSIPVNTSALTLVAVAVVQATDQDGKPKANQMGEPLWRVQLLVTGDGAERAELLDVTVPDRSRAVVVSLFDAIDELAGAGCLSDELELPEAVRGYLVPALECVVQLVGDLGERLEMIFGQSAAAAPGWCRALEILTAVSSAAQVGLCWWGEPAAVAARLP